MEKNKDELVAVQPVLREWTPAFGYKQYGVPYHPGALKFFKERNLTAAAARMIGPNDQVDGTGGCHDCHEDRMLRRGSLGALAAVAMLGLGGQAASAQTYGLATMQPGTLTHTVGVRHRQDAEGEGRPEHAGAGDRRRVGADPDGGARRDRTRHGQHAGGGRGHRDRQAAERPAHHRLDLRAAHRLLRPQGQRHRQHGRRQGQARAGRLFRHAHARQEHAGDAGDRRPDAERRQAGAWCRTCCAAATTSWPAPNDMFMFSFGGPKVREADATVGGVRALEIGDKLGMRSRKIFPYGYFTDVEADPGLCRRRRADEGLQPWTTSCSPTPR